MAQLAGVCFGSFRPPETNAMWQTMADGGVVVCDGPDLVAMSPYLDLELTVPGGAVLRTAGLTWVAVAPTHRRRGLLRAMFAELHPTITHRGYPVAALLASEGGIYGRFGYGPATVEHRLEVQRRGVQFHPDVADPGGVRVVLPQQHRAELVGIYERWRRRTPGGLYSPPALWDEVFADRESTRRGGSPFFCLLHRDGFAMYRVHSNGIGKSVEVTKLAALTSDAHIALWRVLLGLDLVDTVTVNTYPADPLHYLFADPRRVRAISSEDALWLRIIDIPAALGARTYEADLSAVLEVADPELGRDETLELTIRGGIATAKSTTAAPDVRLDRSVLGSIYLGAHRPSSFARAQRLQCGDSQLIAQLDRAFASRVPADLGYSF